jgi:uncharacterized protein (TIGR02270 family)
MRAITEQHADQAAFLFTRREHAARSSHYGLRELTALDRRVEAHLDGVRLAGGEGAKVARDALAAGEPGAAFVFGERALGARDPRAFAHLLDQAMEHPELVSELDGALAWTAPAAGDWAVRALLHKGCPPFLWRMGIDAKVAHRLDPGDALVHALWGDDPALRKAGLRAVGALGRRDLLTLAQEDYERDASDVRAEAAISGALLGDRRAVDVLWSLGSELPHTASLALRAEGAPRGYFQSLGDVRATIEAVEAALDTAQVGWLLERLREPEHARLAGRALRTITGVAIEGPLRGAAPEGVSAGPTDDPAHANVSIDPDEHLPWPVAGRVESVVRDRELPRGRALWGQPVSTDICRTVLAHGTQRERHAAALELALQAPGAVLPSVTAPGFRQRA